MKVFLIINIKIQNCGLWREVTSFVKGNSTLELNVTFFTRDK